MIVEFLWRSNISKYEIYNYFFIIIFPKDIFEQFKNLNKMYLYFDRFDWFIQKNKLCLLCVVTELQFRRKKSILILISVKRIM